jgi:hypothetical protein
LGAILSPLFFLCESISHPISHLWGELTLSFASFS